MSTYVPYLHFGSTSRVVKPVVEYQTYEEAQAAGALAYMADGRCEAFSVETKGGGS